MSDAASLAFYLAAFLMAAYLFSFGVRRKSGLFVSLSLFIPVVIAGFRYGVGTDYFSYIAMYNTHVKLSLTEFINENGLAEVMFFAIEKLSFLLFDDPRFMFFVSALLTVGFFYAGVRRLKLKYPGLIYFLYLMAIFPVTFNAVRQGIAISIIFFALTYILEKKPTKYLLWTLVAGLFHISALLVLPIYFLGRFIINIKSKIAINSHFTERAGFFIRVSIVSLIISLVCISVFSIVLSIPGFEKYEVYLSFDEDINNNIFFVKLLLVMVMIVLNRQTVFKGDVRQNKLFLTFAIVEVTLLTLGFVSPFVKRAALYFSPFILLLLPNLIDILKGRLVKNMCYILIVLYGITFFTVSYYLLGQADVIPYEYSIGGGQI